MNSKLGRFRVWRSSFEPTLAALLLNTRQGQSWFKDGDAKSRKRPSFEFILVYSEIFTGGQSMVTLKGNEVHLTGNFLKPGNTAPDFSLVDKELQTVTLANFKDKMKFIAVVVSLDTSVCLIELKKINGLAKSNPDAVFLIISKDLPFRQKQICIDEKIENIIVLSDFRPGSDFGKSYGLLISTGPLAGLLTRAILILDKQNKVVYSQLVPEISHEPNLDEALKYFKK